MSVEKTNNEDVFEREIKLSATLRVWMAYNIF